MWRHGIWLSGVLMIGSVRVAGALEGDTQLDEVTVSASRLMDESQASTGTKTGTALIETPMAISVISEERIEALNLANVADVLKYVAGAQDNTNVWEHSDGYNIRGFDQSAYILLDGQLRNDPGWWAASEPFALERIEIIKGPAAVLYGQSPPGGMVAMTSKRPSASARNALDVTVGSFNERAVSLDLNQALNDAGTVRGRLVVSYLSEGDQVETVNFDRQLVQPVLRWQVSENTDFTLISWYQQDTDDYNSGVPAAGTLLPGIQGWLDFETYLGEPELEDTYITKQAAVGYEFNHRFGDAWSLKQNFRHFRVDVTGTDVLYSNGLQQDGRTLNRAIADFGEHVRNWQVDTNLLGQLRTGIVEHTVLMGLDYGHYDWRYDGDFGEFSSIDIFEPVYGGSVVGERIPWVYRSEPRQVAAYVQEQAKIAGHLVLLAGGRYDRAKNRDFDGETAVASSDSKFSGRVGALYLFESGFAPYLSYGTSFLPVTGTDVSGRSFVPETGRQVEVGAKYEARSGVLTGTFAAFDIVRGNMLTRDPVYPAFQVQNGEQRHRGVELEITARPTKGLRVDAAFTWLDAEVIRSFDPGIQGNRPNDVSKVSGSMWVSYDAPAEWLKGWGFDIGANYRGSSFGDPENTLRQPAYTRWDAGLRYAFGGWKVALNGTNLGGKEYVSSCWTTDYCARNEPRLVSLATSYRW